MQLPYLPYEDWKETRLTLHLILQIIGKIRLQATPRKNHWWYITQYVTSRGFATGSIPMGDGFNTFEIVLDVHQEMLQLTDSHGTRIDLHLKDGYSVAAFYADITGILDNWGIKATFVERPMDLEVTKPFAEITEYHHYDWDAIQRFWGMMLWTDGVFKEFSGRFYGKTCPVHLYWHHLDLAVTRFSGKPAPPLPSAARISDKDAYSHEVISFGFWAGDDNTPEPAYYSYTAPAPEGLDKEPLSPESAAWVDANGSPMAILKYKDLLSLPDPRQGLLDFLESAYQAGAKRAHWNIVALTVPPLEHL